MKFCILQVLLASVLPAAAATYTVTTANDGGPGSLRQAVWDANTNIGPDTIAFNIAGPPYTIVLGAALPPIQEAVVIDGYTQPGASVNTLSNGNNAMLIVELTSTAGTGIGINSGGCTVRGLVINGFQRGISMQYVGGNVIEGNFIGLDPTGTNISASPTGTGIESVTTNNLNYIGGSTPAARNVIAGTSIGLDLSGNSVNVVQGNFIGTDRHGNRALYASTAQGIRVQSSFNLIGGPTAAGRNVISGTQNGLLLTGAARFNVVQGNFLGTDVTGTVAVSNILAGITVGGQSNTIGGLTLVPGQPPGNLVAGNVARGMELAGSDHVVQGNLIGTDITGTLRLRNGGDGLVADTSRTLIGGTNAGAGNVIAASGNNGINITSTSVASNLIAGNWIGTDVTGTLNLSNTAQGIRLSGGHDCVIGPSNVIAFNGGNGIAIQNFAAIQNFITANAIYSNTLRGIDLANGNVLDGVSPNDACDGDSSLPNQWQNYPVLTNANSSAGSTTVQGYLPSTANAVFRLEFFASDSCDASSFGEGQSYLGFITMTNAANCTNTFSTTLLVGALGGKAITATATDANNNTSEFSGCLTVTGTTTTPVLTIVPAGLAQVQVSWTPNPPGWSLQETWSFTPSNWSNSPSGTANPATISATNSAKFYRLFKP